MKSLLLVFLFLLNQDAMHNTQSFTAEQWPCDGHPKLLHNERGKPIWFTSNELTKRATNCVAPKLPDGVSAKGVITVEVLIDPTGKVQCTRVKKKGKSVAAQAAMEAARAWTFQPVSMSGEPIAVMGQLNLPLSQNGQTAKGSCGEQNRHTTVEVK